MVNEKRKYMQTMLSPGRNFEKKKTYLLLILQSWINKQFLVDT